MNVKILKDKDGKTFSPKVSAESVCRGGKTTTVETSLTSLETDVDTIHNILSGGTGGDISVARPEEIKALFT